MNRLVGVWWSGGDDDARPAGIEAKGYRSLAINMVGQDFPAIQDILKYVVDQRKSQVASRDKVGENLYNRGVLNSVLVAASHTQTRGQTTSTRNGLRVLSAAHTGSNHG